MSLTRLSFLKRLGFGIVVAPFAVRAAMQSPPESAKHLTSAVDNWPYREPGKTAWPRGRRLVRKAVRRSWGNVTVFHKPDRMAFDIDERGGGRHMVTLTGDFKADQPWGGRKLTLTYPDGCTVGLESFVLNLAIQPRLNVPPVVETEWQEVVYT